VHKVAQLTGLSPLPTCTNGLAEVRTGGGKEEERKAKEKRIKETMKKTRRIREH